MPLFHHVNLGVPTDGLAAQIAFLTDVLGFRPVDPGPEMAAMGVNWFEGDDGAQIHLSIDPDHRAAARAHVAIVLGDQLDEVVSRLETSGNDSAKILREEPFRIAFALDPSGNRWELRQSA